MNYAPILQRPDNIVQWSHVLFRSKGAGKEYAMQAGGKYGIRVLVEVAIFYTLWRRLNAHLDMQKRRKLNW